MSHVPQQGGTVTVPEHSSPAGRQSVADRMQVPSEDSHCPEQQSLSASHEPAAIVQTEPPHLPPLHANEQQSEASAHDVPSTRQ